MNLMQKAASLLRTESARPVPAGKVHVHDSHPLNWLYITYNTVEELVRVSAKGNVEPAAMSRYRWVNSRTLEVQVRRGECFSDGESFTPATVKRNFNEVMRWTAPHPPGTQFNLHPATRCNQRCRYSTIYFSQAGWNGIGKAACHSPDEHRVLERDRVRIRAKRQWRRILVSD